MFRYSFRSVGNDAGGFLNVTTRDPVTGTLVSGGDVEGLFRSEDFGDHWRPVNRGAFQDNWYRIASVAWSVIEANTVYACAGNAGASGGFLASTDGGKTWTMRSTTVQFSGNHAAAPLPTNHPRSTGNLIAQGGGALYVATYDQGVYRSTDNGNTWTNIGLAGGTHYGRSILIDPANADTVYVAMYNENVWKTTNASAVTPSWTQLVGSPAIVEELKMVGTYVYAACNSSGVYRSVDGGTNWVSLNGAFVDTTQSKWQSIDGYVSGSDHIILAGCTTGIRPASDGYRSVIRLTINSGGGVTYADLTSVTANINLTVAPDNKSWWRTANTTYMDWMGGDAFTASHILIDPTNTNRIWVTGAEGVYRSLNGGTIWQLAVNGMPLVINRSLQVDPFDPKHIVCATDDWSCMEITDGIGANASTLSMQTPGGGNNANAVVIDRVDRRLYLGVGERDTNTKGKLYRRDVGSSTWVDEELDSLSLLTDRVTDTFSRSVTDGWGTADLGGAWTLIAGPADAFQVNGSIGTMQLAASSASRTQFLNGTSILDSAGSVDMSWNIEASGTGIHFGQLLARSDGTTSNAYTFRVEQDPTTGVLTMRIIRNSGGVGTQVGGNPTVAYTAGQTVTMKYKVQGTNPTNLYFKAWTGGPGAEPGWMITTTDSTAGLQVAGVCGIRSSGATGYTAAALFRYDNLNIDELSAVVGAPGDKRIVGVGLGRDGSNNRVVLAAIEENGLWRQVGGGNWTRVSTAICAAPQLSRAARFEWLPGTPNVYVFDRTSAIHRSTDYGATWTQIWATTGDNGKHGFIALNPAVANELWVSLPSSLNKLSGANSGTVGSGITPTVISVSRPGALKILDNGIIYCISLPTTGMPVQLLRSTDGGTTWQDIADESFKLSVNRPSNMDIGSDGRIYVSSLGTGVFVGYNIGQSQTVS